MNGTDSSRTHHGSLSVTQGRSFTLSAFSCCLFLGCIPSCQQMLACPGGRSSWQGDVGALGRGWLLELGMMRKLTGDAEQPRELNMNR